MEEISIKDVNKAIDKAKDTMKKNGIQPTLMKVTKENAKMLIDNGEAEYINGKLMCRGLEMIKCI